MQQFALALAHFSLASNQIALAAMLTISATSAVL
jgi:hypothetical protein